MRTKRMPDRDRRIVEIAALDPAHSEPLHETPGPFVEGRGERHDLGDSHSVEAVGDSSLGGFGGKAMTPGRSA